MRLAKHPRRTVAVIAATALLTGGAFAGPLISSASAATVSSVSPKFPLNNGVKTLTINGSAFGPSSATRVTLHKTQPAAGQDDIAGSPQDNSQACAIGGGNCGSQLSFTADLTNAAPGAYDVIVLTGPSETDTCAQCLVVTAAGNPTITSVTRYNGADGQLEIRGNNLSKGTLPQFVVNGANDTGLTFDPHTYGRDQTGNPTTTSGYVSSTVLRGTYGKTASVTPGQHLLQLVTTDAQTSNSVPFYQPVLAAATPAALGQGATNVPVTVSGQGFAPGSAFSISSVASTADISVQAPTASSLTAVTEPVSVTATSAAQSRSVTLRGPDGGFDSSASIFGVTAGPKFATSSNPLMPATPVAPSTRGQGSSTNITVTGSSFQPGITFDFGPGTTSTTSTSDASSAVVTVTIADNAPTGAHDVLAVNPDHGTAKLASGFTVTPAPRISSVSGGHAPAGGFADLTLTGTGFDTKNGVTLTVSPAADTQVTMTNASSATQVTARITVGPAAASGLRDLVLTNNGDGGTSTCTGCFSVDQLTVSPPSSTNNTTKTLTLTRTSSSPAFGPSTTVRLYLPGNPSYQAPINGTVTNVSDPSLTVDVPLLGVATGSYTVETTTGTTVLTCGGCFTVVAPAPPTVTSVSPTSGGQGATQRQITVTGSDFYPGETVTFSGAGVTASNVVTSADHTTLTALVDIGQTAATGARDVTVRNIGDGQAGTKTGGFTVNAGPKVTGVSPSSAGQGAVNASVTLSGSGFAPDVTASFGPGTSTTQTSVATDGTSAVFAVSVAGDAAAGTRDVTVNNPGDGGTGTAASAFTVTPGPAVSSISPSLIRTNGSSDVAVPDVQVNGANFVTTKNGDGSTNYPVLSIANVTATVKSVATDGTSLVADLVVKAGAPRGTRAVTVVNPDAGRGTLTGGLTLADVPVAPVGVTAATRSGGATIIWSFPTAAGSDGGQPLTGFRIDDGDQNTANAVTVGPDARTADLPGLVNGTTYTFTVVAINRLGDSLPGTATGTPSQSTRLTSLHNPATIISGGAVTLYGFLTKADGTVARGSHIVVRLAPLVGGARLVGATTDATGRWALRVTMTYITTVTATFSGSPGLIASRAAAYRLGVATRITRTAPATGTTTPARTVLAVKGTTSPNKAGRTVGLYTGGQLLATGVVGSTGGFTINSRLPRGTYTVRIAIGATTGNLAGKSSNFIITRS